MSTTWLQRSLIELPGCYALMLSEEAFYAAMDHMSEPRHVAPHCVSPGKDATVHFFPETEHHRPAWLVCVKDARGKDPLMLCGLLVHESVHIWQLALQMLGEHSASSEFEAYSVQTIAQSLMESARDQLGASE